MCGQSFVGHLALCNINGELLNQPIHDQCHIALMNARFARDHGMANVAEPSIDIVRVFFSVSPESGIDLLLNVRMAVLGPDAFADDPLTDLSRSLFFDGGFFIIG